VILTGNDLSDSKTRAFDEVYNESHFYISAEVSNLTFRHRASSV